MARNLIVFDIDHTLFTSQTKVHIKKNGKRIYTYKSQREFETKPLNPGEEHDFSEMRDSKLFLETARPVGPVLRLCKKLFDRFKHTHEFAIITARGSMDNPQYFVQVFKNHNIPITDSNKQAFYTGKAHIYRAGDTLQPSHVAKRMIIEKRIRESKGGYNKIVMYDDSPKNLDEFLKIKGPKLEAFLIVGDHYERYNPK